MDCHVVIHRPHPKPMLPETPHCHCRRCFRWERGPCSILPKAEVLRARRFTWGLSLRASGEAHRARSNRPFVVLRGLCRRPISAARAALGDAAALSRWRRRVKLATPFGAAWHLDVRSCGCGLCYYLLRKVHAMGGIGRQGNRLPKLHLLDSQPGALVVGNVRGKGHRVAGLNGDSGEVNGISGGGWGFARRSLFEPAGQLHVTYSTGAPGRQAWTPW